MEDQGCQSPWPARGLRRGREKTPEPEDNWLDRRETKPRGTRTAAGHSDHMCFRLKG